MRRLRFVLTVLAIGAVASHAWPAVSETVMSSRIPLYPDKPNERRVGMLLYRGGLVLKSAEREFGGLSDLIVSSDGMRLTAVSDEGHWFQAHLGYDAQGDLASVTAGRISPMLNLAGMPMHGKEGDAEGLTAMDGDPDGNVLVSFERDNRIWRYDLSRGAATARPEFVPTGDWIAHQDDNLGIEALTLVSPTSILALSEATHDAKGDLQAGLTDYPGGGTHMLSVVEHKPFAVTSVARAPDGGLYILERRFSVTGGLGADIRHVPASDIHEGARLDGEVVADLDFQTANIDNMEGMALRIGPKGETLLYLISDDNFAAPLQRTLLLMFEVR